MAMFTVALQMIGPIGGSSAVNNWIFRTIVTAENCQRDNNYYGHQQGFMLPHQHMLSRFKPKENGFCRAPIRIAANFSIF